MNDFWSVSRLPGNATQVLGATRFPLKTLKKKIPPLSSSESWKSKKKKNSIRKIRVKKITVLITIIIMVIAAIY